MTREQITEMAEIGMLSETAAVFDEYIDAIVGYTSDGLLVYDYEKMVQVLVDRDGMSAEDAMEWLDYNTIRSLPYIPEAPVIMYSVHEGE